MMEEHTKFLSSEIWFLSIPICPFLGASPDGIVGYSCYAVSLLMV